MVVWLHRHHAQDDDDVEDIKEDISLTSPSFPSSPTIS